VKDILTNDWKESFHAVGEVCYLVKKSMNFRVKNKEDAVEDRLLYMQYRSMGSNEAGKVRTGQTE